MISAIRSSKRVALGGVLGVALVFVSLLAIKDMNDKVSNSRIRMIWRSIHKALYINVTR